jgi:hypothetical protein
MGENADKYRFAEDGKLVDRKTNKVAGTWTQKGNGQRVPHPSPYGPGGNDTFFRGVPNDPTARYFGQSGNDWPVFTGPADPNMPPIQRAFAQGVERSGLTQLLPNLQQQGQYGPGLVTPQFGRVMGGEQDGFTPGEVLNIQNERENLQNYYADQRRQMGLDTLEGAYRQQQNMLGSNYLGDARSVLTAQDRGYAKDQQLSQQQMGTMFNNYDAR